MKNKLSLLLVCLLIASLLFGCARAENQTETTTATAAVSTTAQTTQTTTQKASTKAQTTAAASTTTTTKKVETTTKKGETTTSSTTKKKTAAKKATTKKTAQKTTAKHTSTTAKKTSSTAKNADYCTVTIQCKALLSNLDKLKDGHEAYVPASGYIVKSCSVKYEKGDNVYTVVQRVCRENGIKMRAKKTAYGMYIVGFNEIDEKDCGGTSGWTYYVDGKFPNVAVDKYNLKGGENIELKYVA